MIDFEPALQKAFSIILPNSEVKGCYFHYSQALFKNFRKFTSKKLAKNENFKEILTKMTALALLPENDIEPMFEKIKVECSEFVGRKLRSYFNYYSNFWINRVKPQRFCMYRKLKRTNNLIERYHRMLNHKFKIDHDPWMFIKKLGELQATTRRDFETLRNGKPLTRMRYTWMMKNHALVNAWDKLDDGLPGEDFIILTSTLFKKFYRTCIVNAEK